MTLTAAKGALLGLVVAVLARLWMRLISDDPEFTWGGTIAILVVFTIFGACTGLVGAALSRGRSGWWRVAAIPGLGAFLAQGIVVLPLALLSAALFAPRGPAWLRWGLAVAGVALTVAIADDQGTGDLVLTMAGMLALGLLGGVGWGRVLRRRDLAEWVG
ncbi:hypothetical protein J2X46_002895 [Nocardioides sp. BE266]|uniref:hypothetical protein n=1 Tax=Nocardioides sp. BE266 TaxID=2817725 RepID=UPI002857AF52|nr:hypothetical protein [Nocardioides sp. BE266]MDR7253905.1 hypothetical protein [Nocardioides sp. BE266]